MTEGRQHTVRGRVTTRGISIQGLRVELLAPGRSELFDCAFTDETGAFALRAPSELLTTLFGDELPRFFFRVFSDQRPLADTHGEVEWSPANGAANVRIDATRPPRDSDLRPTPYLVRGRLTDKAGRPLSGHKVEALDKNLRPKETRIGSSETDRDGAFSIRYQPEHLGRPGKHKADLVLELVQSDRVRHHLWGPRCRADTTIVLSLSLGGREVSPAYDRLMAKVEPALEDVPLGRLDGEDAEYLACSLGMEGDDVQELVAAHRLAPELRIEADVVWALVHAGLPADLEALLERGRSAWRSALESAIRSDEIAARDARTLEALLDRLTSAAVEHLATSERARFASLMRTVRDGRGRELVNERDRRAIVEAWMKHDGSPDALWEALERSDLAEVLPHVRRTLQLSAMTRDHLPLVAAVQKRFAEESLTSLRDLATWTRDDWEALIASQDDSGEAVGVPAGIAGDDERSRRAEYAERMTREFEATFPTRALGHRVASDEQLADEDLVAFFEANPDFEMKETRLRDWLAERPDALRRAADPEKLETRLRAVERLVRITPRQEMVRAVMSENVSSAAELHAMGKTRFRKALARKSGPAGLTAEMAEMAEGVWQNICWNVVAAQALYGKLHPNLQGPRVYAIQGAGTQIATHGTVADLTTLFGSHSACACEHCRSVFSPAAYLVDLLKFLHRYDAKEVKVETLKPGPFVQQPVEVSEAVAAALAAHSGRMDRLTETLPERARIAIGDTSPSLETLVANPTDFLVGRLDDDVAKDAKVQNTLLEMASVAKDVLANVERNPLLELRPKTARDVLLSRRRDIGHLPLTCDNTDTPIPYIDLVNEALEHRLTNRPFHADAHDLAYQALAERDVPWSLPFHLWESETRAWLAHLGTSRADLMEALPAKADDAVRRAQAFDRIGVTRRAADVLATADPWTMWGFDTEAKLDDWVAGNPTVAELMRRAAVSYEELVALLGTTYVAAGEKLEIASLESDEPLTCDLDKLYVKRVSASNLARLHRFERTRRALGWSIADVDRAITVFALPVEAELLERLATVEMLRAAVKRPVEELLTWWGPLDVTTRGGEETSSYARVFMDARIADVDSALALVGDPPKIAGEGVDFEVHQAAVLAALGITADDLRLLVDEEACMAALERSAPVPNPTTDLASLTALYRHVQCARALRLRVSELLRLLELSGLDPFDGSDLESAIALAELAARLRERKVAVAELDHLVRGVPFADELDATRIGQLLDDIVAELAGLLEETKSADPNEQGPQPDAIKLRATEAVVARLASALQLDERLVRVLATSIVQVEFKKEDEPNQPQVGKVAIIDQFVAHLSSTETPTYLATRSDAIRRLHKAGRLATMVRISPDELTMIGQLTGWLDDDGMPLTLAPQPSRFGGYQRLDRLMRARERLRGGGETLVTLLGMAAGKRGPDGVPIDEGAAVMTTPELIEQVAARAGWVREDVAYLAKEFGFSDLAPWVDGEAIPTLVDAFDQLRRLGVSAADAQSWTEPTPDLETWKTIAKEARAAARSRRDAASWAEASRPVDDELRTKRRDALVAALLQEGPYTTTTDLYDALLLDVEMDPCRMTSRLKQAISATQLFIQRCFLNLEPTVQLDEDAAREWTWRKNYRVWEANRKVFLYPENWIQGRLRDDKTPLFQDLEKHLLQGELTDERAESAVFAYIDGLEQLSHLEVLSVLERRTGVMTNPELHLFAKGADQKVWYRMRDRAWHWRPWEKVPFDIEGNLLISCVTPNGQIRALWLNSLEGEYDDDTNTVARWPEIRLLWSDLSNGGWTPARSSGEAYIASFPDPPRVRGRWLAIRSGDRIDVEYHTVRPRFFDTSYKKNDPVPEPPPPSTWSGLHIGTFTFAHAGAPPKAWSEARPSSYSAAYERHFPLTRHHTWKNGAHVEWDHGDSERAFSPRMGNRWVDALYRTPHGDARMVAHPMLDDVSKGAFVFQDDKFTFVVSRSGFKVSKGPAINTTIMGGKLQAHEVSGHATLRFELLHHPLSGDFAHRAYTSGLDAFYRWDGGHSIQRAPNHPESFFESTYKPNHAIVDSPHPVVDVDFSWRGASSAYNWELFFHVPFAIGEQLSQRRRFEDAMRWYQRIFDPTTGSDAPVPARFWKVRPFYEAALSTDGKMPAGVGVDDEDAQIAAWQDDPFNPHLIARMRPVAYQKAVVMKYLDNLVAWADQLFRRYSIESLNEATQLYLLAAKILGPRPTEIAPRANVEGKTYLEIADDLDAFSNALVEVESFVPPRPSGWTCPGAHGLELPTTPYFCTPPNEQLLAYWDKIEDRLFKIRHCMDIEGRVRQLPLFEAPIDPGVLVRARAAGVDIGEVLNGLAFQRPTLRFEVMLRRAQDLVNDVRQLGSSVLSALEKRDAEQLAQLRQTHELDALRQVRDERKLAIGEARESLEGLQKAREQARLRLEFFENRERFLDVEFYSELAAGAAVAAEFSAGVLHSVASGLSTIPQGYVSPVIASEYGGEQISAAVEAAAHGVSTAGTAARAQQASLDREAMRFRRAEDWDHTAQVAAEEVAQLDKQIAAAELRIAIAEQQLASHDLAIRQSREVGDFLRTKFSDDELYDWMIGELSAVYFQLYELAYEGAKKAEAAFRFELGLETSDYVTFGYWSDLHKGLLAGDKLALDLRRLEMAYVERDKRELELSRSVSLVLHDPAALMNLKATGTCKVTIPEEFFDADYPGHYFRRLRNVTLTIPCVAGPHTPINCRLTLDNSRIRVDPVKTEPYADQGSTDMRFRRDLVPGSSIATSTARNDAGVFEVSFNGPRYLPFEGAGADSTWTISLPKENNSFDFDTITDVVLRLDYTARDGGESLEGKARDNLAAERKKKLEKTETETQQRGLLQRLISLRHEMREAWEQLVRPEDPSLPCELVLTHDHFPFIFRNDDLVVDSATVWVSRPESVDPPASAKVDLGPPKTSTSLEIELDETEGTFTSGSETNEDGENNPWNAVGTWTLKAQDPKAFKPDNVRDVWLLLEYRVAEGS